MGSNPTGSVINSVCRLRWVRAERPQLVSAVAGRVVFRETTEDRRRRPQVSRGAPSPRQILTLTDETTDRREVNPTGSACFKVYVLQRVMALSLSIARWLAALRRARIVPLTSDF